MKIALAQINPTVGDLEGNLRKIETFHARAAGAGAGLVVFSELAITGYPPLDLVARGSFVREAEDALDRLAGALSGPPAVVGCVLPNPEPAGRPVINAAVVIHDHARISTHGKSRLPTYDVFDEDRYFEQAARVQPLTLDGVRVGVTICEDIWPGPEDDRPRYRVDPVEELGRQGIDLLVNLSASPFHAGKSRAREKRLQQIATGLACPVVLVNQVGGNDSLLFDGRSLAVAPGNKLLARAAAFTEDLVLADPDTNTGDRRPSGPDGEAELVRAIVMGIRDYMDKCGFTLLVLGLSGGIDSAVCAVLAAEAAGPDRVWALAMPSGYSSPHSRSDAEQLAANLGIHFENIPIDGMLQAHREALQPAMDDVRATLVEENLQARIRGALVMAHANHHRQMLALATGNKSELAVGYCTLYGDMVGGLAPLGDLFKTRVYQVAEYINRSEEVIPRRIIERPPSAELRPGQVDTDSLPPYDVLDPVLELYVEQGLDARAIRERGFDPATVDRVVAMVERSEFKRRQAAPVLRVTPRAFGAGRQIPIARGRPS